MKRKRGHRKGKQKQLSAPKAVSKNAEDDSVLEDLDSDNAPLDSQMEVETVASAVFNQPTKLINADADGLIDRPAAQPRPGRVKVKLKSSKLLGAQHTNSDAQTQSDTDKSSSHLYLERQGEAERMDDGANSVSEKQLNIFEKSSRKAGSIKIKSSKGMGSLNTIISQMKIQGEKSVQTVSDNHKSLDSSMPRESHQREIKSSQDDPQYNEQELNAALAVIKKVMKMDAAEPFNIPVNPVALGIPDYFDIIENPMDFGTICNNLERGNVYMNSKDVFKDVQYIWENCYRYNNKGDYILDLMKRVRKNFTKYWTAAGLYSDQQNKTNEPAHDQESGIELPAAEDHRMETIFGTNATKKDTALSKQENIGTSSLKGSENPQLETIGSYSQQKLHVKGTKRKKRRRHGISRHKNDCLCAVCVVRRRRLEREENAQVVESQTEPSDGNLSQDFRHEETSLERASSEDASSNMECSPDPDADVDLEGQGEESKPDQNQTEQQGIPIHEKQEISENGEVQNSGKKDSLKQSPVTDGLAEEPNTLSVSDEIVDLGDAKINSIPQQQKEEAAETQKLQQKQDVSQERLRQIELCKHHLFYENDAAIELCNTLFSDDPKAVWSGPHSLVRHHKPARSNSAIGAAIDMFMK